MIPAFRSVGIPAHEQLLAIDMSSLRSSRGQECPRYKTV